MALDGRSNELGAALPAIAGGQQDTSNVQQAPTPPAPIVDTRTFTQKLLSGLLAGASGGIAAPRSSEQGGLLGLQAAEQYDAKYKNDIAQQNILQQKQFAQQLQQQDQQNQNQQVANANEMHQVQLHTANLNALEAESRIRQLPGNEQVAYAERQKKLYDAYKDTGRDITIVPDDLGALADVMKSNPDLHPGNFEAIHIPGPDGQAGQVAIVKAAAPTAKPIPGAKKSELLKSVGFDTKGLDLNTMKDADFFKMFQAAALKQIDEKGQNQRNAATIAAENARNAANNALKKEMSGISPEADQAKIDALHNGTAVTSDFTAGMGGAKEVQRLTNIWLKQHPEDAANVEKFKAQAKQAQEQTTTQALASGRTLFQKNGSIDQVEELLKTIPRSQFPDLNHWLQTGVYKGGDAHVAAVISTLPDVQDLLAKFNTGSGSQTSDLRIKQAQSQLRQSDSPEQTKRSLNALRNLATARYRGIVGSGTEENKFLTSRYTPESFGENRSQGVIVNGFQFPDQKSADAYKKETGIK